MYKILIVDDEQIIRNGIVNSIDWGSYNYIVAGEAENGKDALIKALETKPDVILTDIYMPIMNGIEFSREIKKHLPDVIIIFLTGYNEFTFAQQAIEVGIFRYITKPILHNELVQTLVDASDILEHKELEKVNMIKLKKLLNQSLPLFKERFFLNLVNGTLSESEIEKKLNYLNLDINAEAYLCAIITIDDFAQLSQNNSEADMNLMKFSVQNIAEEVLSDQNHIIYAFEEKRSEIGILCCIRNINEEDCLTAIQHKIEKIQDYSHQYLKFTVSAGIGRMYTQLIDTVKSYSEAVHALEYRMAFGRNSIILIDDIGGSSQEVLSHNLLQKINDLMLNTKGGSKEEAERILNDIFESLKSEGAIKRDYIQLMGIEIINRIIRINLEFGADYKEIFGDRFTPFSLMQCDTLEDIHKELLKIISNSVQFVLSRQNTVTRNSIEKAKDFILENYSNPDLNLKLISESIHMSLGYFSQLFKQVTGETCIEYLTKIRIDASKKLLKKTSLKTYEVAEKVGFKDSQYFSTCFKKAIGVSPTEYRDIIKDDFLS
jgi:two-component system response regulator YesN